LKPGVTLRQAEADLKRVQQTLGLQYPKTDEGWAAAVEPLKDRVIGKVHRAMWLLLGSAGVLLLITCANVACLLLGRLNARTAEIATRSALGAGRAVIARQLFVEGLMYAVVGGGLAAGIVVIGAELLRGLPQVPRVAEMRVDARVAAIVAAMSVATAVLFSLAPVLQTFRRNFAGSLVRGGRVVGGGQRLPRLLVAAQLALSTVLLIGAGLFVRSLLKLQETDLGFRPEKLLTFRVSASYSEIPAAALQRHHRTMEALAALPGVESVAMSTGPPGAGSPWPTEFRIQGEAEAEGHQRYADTRVVTAGYFRTVGIPIVSGETCRMSTDTERPFEALVNRKFADRYLRGRNPVGRTLIEGQLLRPLRIRGVVEDIREAGLSREPEPLIYMCGYLLYWPDSDYLVRTQGDPGRMAQVVRTELRKLEPARAVYLVRPLTEAIDGTLGANRFRALLVSLFSAMALVLSAVGLYGVMAYMVTQRSREIGIRMALGARPGTILGDVVRSAGVLAGAGLVIGLGLAAVAAKLTERLLFGVRPFDQATYLGAVVVLFGVAVVASAIPGRRATGVDPVRALREQ
jgi:predicted permease